MMEQILSQLKNSKRVLVVTHENPDGDAVSSLLAMGLALEALGKKTTLYNESPLPSTYRFLPNADKIQHRVGSPDQYDTAVVLDCGSLERVGTAVDRIRQIPVIINIDHHATNKGFGDYQLVSPSACATAEVVYGLIKALGVTIDRDMAVCIYTGILTDTGSFRFSNTSRAAFVICDEMLGCGVEPGRVARHIYGTYSLGRIKLLTLALDSVEMSSTGELAVMVVTDAMMKKTGTCPEDVDGLIQYARGIETVKLAALIQETTKRETSPSLHDGFHVSLRSNGTVDAAAVAAIFNGGGHFSAAGFFTDRPLPEVKQQLFDIGKKLEQREQDV